MTEQTDRVARIEEEHGDEVAALVARAFQDDPLCVFACPNPDERARWLPWLFRGSVWRGFLYGVTLGTVGRLDGVAITIGPGGGELREEQLAHFGYGRGREAVGAGLWDRSTAALNAVFDTVDAALHRAVAVPHWYLDVLAVAPERQGVGVGSTLIRAVNVRADADGLPVALLTFQPRNLAFYQRHGYVVIEDGTDPTGGLRWWGFCREPGNQPPAQGGQGHQGRR